MQLLVRLFMFQALNYDDYAEDEVSFRITGHFLKNGSPTGELGTLRSGNTRRKGKCKWMRTLSGFKCIKTHRVRKDLLPKIMAHF